jgi:hypothetical protein
MADPQDSLSQVRDQVREVGDNMKSGFTFPKQRQAVSDWWNSKVGAARDLWNKSAGPSDVKAADTPSAAAPAQPKTVTAPTTAPSIKRSAAKRKTAGGSMNKSFGGLK